MANTKQTDKMASAPVRQLVFVFPFALIFADMAKKDASAVWTVWLTFVIAEVISAVIAVVLFVRLYRKKVVNS